MVSSLTQDGADVTFAALELGAVDFLAKPAGTRVAELKASGEILVAKVLAAARSRGAQPPPEPPKRPPRLREAEPGLAPVPARVVLGISTGGPQALGETILPPHPADPAGFDRPAHAGAVHRDFAQRLDRACPVRVKEAEEGDPIVPNQILIAPAEGTCSWPAARIKRS